MKSQGVQFGDSYTVYNQIKKRNDVISSVCKVEHVEEVESSDEVDEIQSEVEYNETPESNETN